MSWTDEICKSPELTKEEQRLCYQLASDFYDMIADLDKKGHLRSELILRQAEVVRMNSLNILLNVRKSTQAFNMFFDMYVDKMKPDSKQRLKKFLELNKPYGLTEDDLRYLLYSEMIFVFLQNIEEFRFAMLFIMKLPIHYTIKGKRKTINRKTTLGTLLKSLKEMGIRNVDKLRDIDYNLRNGLSHCLFWFDEKGDPENPEPHLHYSEDMTFENIGCISITDLFSKMRKQAIYSNCLLYLIGDWFR